MKVKNHLLISLILSLGVLLIVFVSSSAFHFVHIDSIEDAPLSGTDQAFSMDIQGDYIYVGGDDQGFEIVDISDPTNAFVTGYMTGNLNDLYEIRDLKVQGDYAYIVYRSLFSVCTDCENSLGILDISDKSNPTLSGSLFFLLGNATDLSIQGDYAYALKNDFISTSLEVISILDKTNPSLISSYVLGVDGSDVIVEGDYAYVVSDISSKLLILDISDPTNIMEISVFADNSITALNGAWSFVKENNYLYILSNEGIEIIDVSDVSNPIHVDAIFKNVGNILDGNDAQGIFVKDNGDEMYLTLKSATEGIFKKIVKISGNYVYQNEHLSDDNVLDDILLDYPHEIIVNNNYVYVTSSENGIVGGLEIIGNDTTAPFIEIINPLDGSTIIYPGGILPVDFTANASDASGIDYVHLELLYPNGTLGNWYSYSINQSNSSNNIYSLIIGLSELGSYQATFTAYDIAGNYNSEISLFNIVGNDTTAPFIEIINPLDGSTIIYPGGILPVDFTANASDASGIDYVHLELLYPNGTLGNWYSYSINQSNSSNNIYSLIIGLSELGSYQATFTAYDIAGNYNSEISLFNIVGNDTTAPFVEIISPLSGSSISYSGGIVSVDFIVNASDDFGIDYVHLELLYSNGTIANFNLSSTGNNLYSLNLDFSELGDYQATFTVYDLAGNYNSEISLFSLTDSSGGGGGGGGGGSGGNTYTYGTPEIKQTYVVQESDLETTSSSKDKFGITGAIIDGDLGFIKSKWVYILLIVIFLILILWILFVLFRRRR